MYKSFIKRFLDLLFALCLLPVFLLLYLFILPFIFFTDHGPVFYSSPRRGKDGKIFMMHKFRSMINNAPDIRNDDGSTFNAADDPRLTKIGRLIRMTSLDEVPQILNIIRGEMSFVGPRPTMTEIPVEEYDAVRKKRIEVRPGITGFTQAYYRNSISQADKFELDAFYVDNLSFWLDIKIFFKTFSSIFYRKNIYNKPSKLELDR